MGKAGAERESISAPPLAVTIAFARCPEVWKRGAGKDAA